MKRKMYIVRLPNGRNLKDGSDVAHIYHTIQSARKSAKKNNGQVGFWDWSKGKFLEIGKSSKNDFRKKTRKNCGCNRKYKSSSRRKYSRRAR